MPTKRKTQTQNPHKPLAPRREAFALAIVKGMKLQDAHKAAGYDGKTHAAAWQMRHSPDIDARIQALLGERVKADARQFARRQKVHGDILDNAVKRLAEMAFTDVRELIAWKAEPVINADGEVIGERPRLVLRDSADISPAAATLIKSAFLKAGEIRVETHDQRSALVDLVKLLKGSDAAPPSSVTVNQVNVGAVDAVTAAQKVAFLLAAAAARAPAPPTAAPLIEGERVHKSKDMDGDGDP